MKLGLVLLASGFSRRFGGNKLLYPVEGRSLAERAMAELEALQLAGHTPGSCTFGVPAWKELFTGDAVGSGDIVLMTLPGASSVSAYRASLERFVRRAAAYADTEWRGGHFGQAGEPGTPAYHPPCMRVALDMIALCKALLDGHLTGEPVEEPNAPGGHALRAHWGTAGMVYVAVE